jgi:hypothetical protein
LFILTLDTITTFKLAVGIALVTVDVVSIITGFTQKIISNTITTVGDDASSSASIGEISIPDTHITLFLGINDTITAIRHTAVWSASVGKTIVVVRTIITFLFDPASVMESHDIFLDSISASALRSARKTIQNWLQNSVGGGSLSKQNRQNSNSIRSRGIGSVEQLDFEGESLGSNVVFAGFVEFNLGQGVRNSLVVEGSSGQNGEQNIASGVEHNNGSGVVLDVGRMVQIQSTGSRASLRETNGGLHVSSAGTVGGPDVRVITRPEGIDVTSSTLGSSVDFADGKAVGLSVTFLTRVDNTISAFRSLADGRASVCSVILVVSSVITFLTDLDNTISAHRPRTTIHGSSSDGWSGFDLGVSGETISGLLVVSAIWSVDNVSEGWALGRGQELGSWHNKPLNTLSARGSCFGSNVSVGTNDWGQQSLQVDNLTTDGSSASIESTNWRAARSGSVGVERTGITFFVVTSLSDSITTESTSASGRATLRTSNSIITLLIWISNFVTASVSNTI